MDNAKQTIEIPTLEYLIDMFKTKEDYFQYAYYDRPDEVRASSKNPIDCWVSHAIVWKIYKADSLSFIEQIYREEYLPRIIENQSK